MAHNYYLDDIAGGSGHGKYYIYQIYILSYQVGDLSLTGQPERGSK